MNLRHTKIDAAIISGFRLTMKPETWIPPSPEVRFLRALVGRADSPIDMLTQEKNRLATAQESVIPSIKEHLKSGKKFDPNYKPVFA